jgi:hypothetical protein
LPPDYRRDFATCPLQENSAPPGHIVLPRDFQARAPMARVDMDGLHIMLPLSPRNKGRAGISGRQNDAPPLMLDPGAAPGEITAIGLAHARDLEAEPAIG